MHNGNHNLKGGDMRWKAMALTLVIAAALTPVLGVAAQSDEGDEGTITALVVQHLAQGTGGALVVVDSLVRGSRADKGPDERRPLPQAQRSRLHERPNTKLGAPRDFAHCQWDGQQSLCNVTAARLISFSDVVVRGDSAWVQASVSEPMTSGATGQATRVAVSTWQYAFVLKSGKWVMVRSDLTRMT